jgi:hypothetical protein
MHQPSPKTLFTEPIRELRDRAMDLVSVHGRDMVLGKELDSLVQQGSGRSFATLAFTGDFLRLTSTCLLADRKLDPLEVQFLFPLVRPACKLFGKYRKDYLQFANINRGNIHEFLGYYNEDTSLFGFRCPMTRWAGIAIANSVAAKCGDTSFQSATRDHYSRFGDALREVSGGQEQEVSLIIENMLSQFEASTGQADDDMDFEIDLDASPSELDDGVDFKEGWIQQTGPTCAIVAQQMVLQRFGHDVTQDELVELAIANELYDPAIGTLTGDCSKLLTIYGLPNMELQDASIRDLFVALANGQMVIVPVDSGELWEEQADSIKEIWEDELRGEMADHMIVVVGAIVSDRSNPLIVVHDSGHPEGAGQHYPMKQFIGAWEDGNKGMIVTKHAAPDLEDDPIFGSNYNEIRGMIMDDAFWESIFGS